ncbi:MAG: flagellar biosynthesis anti-sigma factor FlgM [Terracidiphilus sp.]
MEISNSLDGLRALLGVNPADPAGQQSKSSGTPAAGSALEADRATVSDAASEVSQAASGEGVRTEKVEAIQAALAAGTYSVPASAVASKLVDAMLAGGE